MSLTTIKLLQPWGTRPAGHLVEVDAERARQMLADGRAEPPGSSAQQGEQQPTRGRGRRRSSAGRR